MLSNDIHVLGDLSSLSCESNNQVVVVRVGDLLEELDTTRLHVGHGGDNIFGAHSDVLDAGAAVVVDVLLDLGLAHAVGGLVDRHLNFLVEVDHDDRAEGRVLSVDLFVIDRPESVEVQHLFVPLSDGLHFAIGLVSDAMVDREQVNWGQHGVQFLLEVVGLESWEEGSLVVSSLHESVDGITVGLDRCGNHTSELVFSGLGLVDGRGSSLDALGIDSNGIVDGKRNIFDTVTVLGVVGLELGGGLGVDGSLEDVDDLVVADNVGGKVTVASLESL